MATKFFKKESIRSEVRDANNRLINFIPVFGGDGVLALDETNDADAVAALNRFADARIGGVLRISAEIYESLKKNAPLNQSPRPSMFSQMRVSPSLESFKPVVAVQVADADVKQGIRIMEDGPPRKASPFVPRSRATNPAKVTS